MFISVYVDYYTFVRQVQKGFDFSGSLILKDNKVIQVSVPSDSIKEITDYDDVSVSIKHLHQK